jgi:hypothetical protein
MRFSHLFLIVLKRFWISLREENSSLKVPSVSMRISESSKETFLKI